MSRPVRAYRRQRTTVFKMPKGQPPKDREFLMTLYNRQNTLLEQAPKQFDNRTLGLFLEHLGDIYRELTGRTYPDSGYIDEKLRRAAQLLYKDFRPEGLFETERALIKEDQQLLFQLHENLTGAWSGQNFRAAHEQINDKVYASILNTWYDLYKEATKDLRSEAELFDKFHDLACALKSAGDREYINKVPTAQAMCIRRGL